MADSDKDWSDSGRPKLKSKSSSRKKGPSDLLRVMSPISNLASLKRGGKVKKMKRSKMRMKGR